MAAYKLQPSAPRPRRRARLFFQRFTEAARSVFLHEEPRANRLDADILEALFSQEPWLNRGITKHAGDVVKHGFRLTKPSEANTDHAEDKDFQAWARSIRLAPKWNDGLVSAHVYGDGLLEYEYDDGGSGDAPVLEGAELVDVHVVDPAYVRFRRFKDDDGTRRHYLVQEVKGGEVVKLHPDRYEHLRLKKLPGRKHGLSSVEVAFHAAMSKVKADQGLGEILYRNGVPFRQAAIKDASDQDIADLTKILLDRKMRDWVVWDDSLVVTQHNPSAPNPQPYYDALGESIAAAIGVGVMMLKGAQAGAVTGSETNLVDYHSDLLQVKVNVLEPGLERVVAGRLGLTADEYDVAWAPFPVSDEAEAVALRERATAFTLLKGAGVDPTEAARVAGLELKATAFLPAPAAPGLLPPVGTRPDEAAPEPVEQPEPEEVGR